MPDVPLKYDPKWYIAAVSWTFRLLRRTPLRPILRAAKFRCTFSTTVHLHEHFAHAVRDFSLRGNDWTDPDTVGPAAEQVCNACQTVLSDLLELSHRDELHCTLKVIVESEDKIPLVATLGRSRPLGSRPHEMGVENAHEAAKNTVFAAMLALDDGYRKWPRYRSFSCNNLSAHAAHFACTRKGFLDCYQSILAFPIRIFEFGEAEPMVLGFLTFDLPHPDGFPGVPDALSAQLDPSTYNVKICQSPVWQAGAMMADILAAVVAFMPQGEDRNDGTADG